MLKATTQHLINGCSVNIFLENQEIKEKDWNNKFGDRKSEIVIIGQDKDEALIRSQLEECLSTVEELVSNKWKGGYEADWPVQRVPQALM